jgi:hypothetical protein
MWTLLFEEIGMTLTVDDLTMLCGSVASVLLPHYMAHHVYMYAAYAPTP